jgi:hypothetical protein
MSTEGRTDNGQFAPGNPGGPGRPRRAIEREYLATLGDAVSLDDWRDVVARAVADAKAGDSAARLWLTKHLIGDKPPALLDLAAGEQRGISGDEQVRDAAARHDQAAKRQAKYDTILERLE